MTDLLARGAPAPAKALMLGGGKKRYGESATEQARAAARTPSRRATRTPTSPTSPVPSMRRRRPALVAGVDLADFGRWALLQHVALDHATARRTTRSPCATPRTIRARRRGAGRRRHRDPRGVGDLRVRHDHAATCYNPEHRWCYFRDMTPDEVLVFKTHDSDPGRAAPRAAHRVHRPDVPAGHAVHGRPSYLARFKSTTEAKRSLI